MGDRQTIEQVSADVLNLNQGTIYPALVRLEHKGWIAAGVGRLKQPSAGKVLLAHPSRKKADSSGNGAMGADGGHCCSRPRRRELTGVETQNDDLVSNRFTTDAGSVSQDAA